jgi:hypothetical protein
MHTAYINVSRHYSLRGDIRTNREIQVESGPDEGRTQTDDAATSIQVFSCTTGAPIGGQSVLDLAQLTELRDALSARIAELAPAAEPARDAD